jgi:hypothetical protein
MRLFGLPDKVVRSGCAPWSNVAKTTAASLGKRRTIMQAGLLNDKWVLITGGTGSFGNEVVVTVAVQPIDVNALNWPLRLDGFAIGKDCTEIPILRDVHVVQDDGSGAQLLERQGEHDVQQRIVQQQAIDGARDDSDFVQSSADGVDVMSETPVADRRREATARDSPAANGTAI